ncbi:MULTISPECIES: 4-hydroxyproline epimerase [unclassified Undibacterium]|uniref:4-hydroxyproline epimerase n=1 Tax=unclassified Undibacterium TaxID=2630295 RepID=UPI002AC8F960|nr:MULTISPECIES: 4-hydroxyproline epimerase [unclassified Undibacterium]MEB0139575.1 4-hydroxyproline epimerase [Undibacterium sp. CCC2.1]MEB0172494.1 4-hydroxyproline epimerase [Undibacterium sp. CCC1.1]MEB0176512.1 4-hydroxyproline epimerase [Undibacterium sp. CCC3.4]MEB0215634.1 4-hydroxyproline epimerase [Undibacterium sp. 5I2]WPX43969.1 4-hydroxyproline epimerase [Undibacterium sp. CCC3.4]
MHSIHVIDSHTGGEPTRVIIAGGPALGGGSVAEQLQLMRAEFDHYRRASVCEPRGADVLVGALVCPAQDAECVAGVIFFNNVGYLGMCGHGLIGFITTLAYQGKIAVGRHKIETPVGIVAAELHDDHSVSVHNVPAYRHARAVTLEVPGIGTVCGDIAWGGNWFFLIGEHQQSLHLSNAAALGSYARAVRLALEQLGIQGANGAPIDHIELFAAAADSRNDSRNFVLCPGGAYDRSPCGTGTSAKLACLAADGVLAPGQIWRQESLIGSVFCASYRSVQNAAGQPQHILPVVRGSAFITAEAQLLLDPRDPFIWGITSTA